VLRFLENMGALCAGETYKPTAPYAPGVTGIGISMADRDLLVSGAGIAASSTLKVVREVLASCVAQNLLEARLDHKNKGERWLVLYLNRLLCLRFTEGLREGTSGTRPDLKWLRLPCRGRGWADGRAFRRSGDRWFESVFLQRRVSCEPEAAAADGF
jgi:hypothetical protein